MPRDVHVLHNGIVRLKVDELIRRFPNGYFAQLPLRAENQYARWPSSELQRKPPPFLQGWRHMSPQSAPDRLSDNLPEG